MRKQTRSISPLGSKIGGLCTVLQDFSEILGGGWGGVGGGGWGRAVSGREKTSLKWFYQVQAWSVPQPAIIFNA